MSEPTIKDLLRMQKLMDEADIPQEGRVMHYVNKDTGGIEEIQMDEAMSPRELLQCAFPKANL